MRFKLRGVGAGPHAIFCREGRRTHDASLSEGTVVEQASEADFAQLAPDLQPIAGDDARGIHLGLAGIFVVPGRGVAALYGCEPVPLEDDTAH